MALPDIVWIACSHCHTADVLNSVAFQSSRLLTPGRSSTGFFQSSGIWRKGARTLMSMAQHLVATLKFVESIHSLMKFRLLDCQNQVALCKSMLLTPLQTCEVKQAIGPQSKGRRKWFLLGQCISPKCLVGLMGMGNERVQRILDGKWDMRRSWGIATRKLCEVNFPSHSRPAFRSSCT